MKPGKITLHFPKDRPIQMRWIDDRGRTIRKSTGTYSRDEAQRIAEKNQAKLTLGIAVVRDDEPSPEMTWREFVRHYERRHVKHLRKRSQESVQSVLSLCSEGAETLAEAASRRFLTALQSRLLNSQLSRHTVRGYMTKFLAALHWAEAEGLVEHVPKLHRIKVAKLKKAKGRPLTDDEIKRLKDACESVVGEVAALPLRDIIDGLVLSGLRLGELLDMHWSDANCIRPHWPASELPILQIPAAKQKNATEEDIPLLPEFDDFLQQRRRFTGHVFEPVYRDSRKHRTGRPSVEWVGKMISKAGQAAGIVVVESPVKYASAHDLRRTCAQRLARQGVPAEVIQLMMRHESYETTRNYYQAADVQAAARSLREG